MRPISKHVILVSGETNKKGEAPKTAYNKTAIDFFHSSYTSKKYCMSSHNENDHIQKEAKNVDLILVIACSSLIPNIYIIKFQDLGEKVYVNRITKFLKKHNLCFSDPIFIYLGHSFCSN